MSPLSEVTAAEAGTENLVGHVNPYMPPRAGQSISPQVQGRQSLLKTLFSFQGRMRRRDYWTVWLIVGVAFCSVDLVVGALLGEDSEAYAISMRGMLVPACWINLAAAVKRLHDRNRSGRWMLLYFIPYIGGIWALIECGCLRGTVGHNKFGPDATQP